MKVGVVPAYNEETTISRVISMSRKYLDEVIVIDDGSYDRTMLMSIKSRASVYQHSENLGKGAALKSGFRKALIRGADIIVTLDADLQHNPHEIPLLLKPIETGKYDIVVGQRSEIKNTSLIRRISNYVSTKLIEFFFDLKLEDSQCGFRAFRRSVLEALSFDNQRYAAESEMLIDAYKKGFKITQVAVTFRPSRKKKGKYWKPFTDLLQFLSIIIRKLFEKSEHSKDF